MNNSKNLAPIAVFAFKRPDHLAQTLASLSLCPLAEQSTVYIFCDAARSETERPAVEATRAVAKSQKWPKELHVIEQTQNLGLAKSISQGVSGLCEKFGRVIVLEDDLEVSPSFLEFLNEGLEKYKDDERVMEVTGYMYPVDNTGLEDSFFMVHASCWGWGTWQRAWKYFGPDEKEFARLKRDRKYRHEFDINGAYPYYKMLQQQMRGQIDSWGVIWYLTIFKRKGLILMPRKTMVKNIGQDGTGTHVEKVYFRDVLTNFQVHSYPAVKEDLQTFAIFQKYIYDLHVPWYRRILRPILELGI